MPGDPDHDQRRSLTVGADLTRLQRDVLAVAVRMRSCKVTLFSLLFLVVPLPRPPAKTKRRIESMSSLRS